MKRKKLVIQKNFLIRKEQIEILNRQQFELFTKQLFERNKQSLGAYRTRIENLLKEIKADDLVTGEELGNLVVRYQEFDLEGILKQIKESKKSSSPQNLLESLRLQLNEMNYKKHVHGRSS